MEITGLKITGRAANFPPSSSSAVVIVAGSEEGEEDEFELVGPDCGAEDVEFDAAVGRLEEILLSSAFVDLQTGFCSRYCLQFEDTDENKLEYMQIFHEYVGTVEHYIEQQLTAALPGFDMSSFLESIESRGEAEVSGDVWDLLLSFSDFSQFKNLMLDFRRHVAGRGHDSPVNSRKARVHGK